jgi:hypothetical protein
MVADDADAVLHVSFEVRVAFTPALTREAFTFKLPSPMLPRVEYEDGMCLPAAKVVATRMSERAMSDSVIENIAVDWIANKVVLLFAMSSGHTSSCVTGIA